MVDTMLDPALLAPERVRPLRRREYEALVERGMFGDERVELLRGVLVTMSPQGDPHARITAWLAQRLSKSLPFDRFDVRSHSPFSATRDSMPEPDVLVAPRGGRGHPSEALLLIEVADSSLVKDRELKAAIYAAAHVPEYWIVDLRTSTVDVFTRPGRGGYRSVATHRRGTVLRPTMLPTVAVAVARIPWDQPPVRRPHRR